MSRAVTCAKQSFVPSRRERGGTHELEGPGLDLVSGCCHAYDRTLAPPAMGRLQRSPHHVHIASAVKRPEEITAQHSVLLYI
jgi:hypothetical protein